jgi:hypothetical protein
VPEDFSSGGDAQLQLLEPDVPPGAGSSQGEPVDSGGGVQGDPVQRAPYPPGTPVSALYDARMPVAMAKTTGKRVTIPEVMAALQNVIQVTGGETPIRVGRFGRGARGVFKDVPRGGPAEFGG